MLGSESAIEGASAEARGGRMPLVERDGSKVEAIVWARVGYDRKSVGFVFTRDAMERRSLKWGCSMLMLRLK
jgi:hypothetical protein